MNISAALQAALRGPARLFAALWQAPLARFCVILFAALSVLVPAFTVSAVKISRNAHKEPELPVPGGAKIIEPDEIFLPPEPGFLPPVFLRRESSGEWQPDAAAAYWTDPAAAGGARWLSDIETAIDSLLENVR